MIKKSIFSVVAILLLLGCNSSSSNSEDSDNNRVEINTWDYLVPNESISLSFDKINILNSNIVSTELDAFNHEYNVISDTEVNGNWRDYEGEYSYKIKHFNGNITEVVFEPIEESSNYSRSSGGVKLYRGIGDFFYSSGGSSGFVSISGNTSSSRNISAGNCVLNNIYDSIELYDGYTYSDVIELNCENIHHQTYNSITVDGVDRYYEYYQKNVGWIGKVDKTCITSIVDHYEFIDDNNETCVKTTVEYKLKNNN